MKRVGFLEDRLGGGIGRVIVNLGNAMVKYGIAVDVPLKDTSDPYLHQLASDIRVIKLNSLHRVWGLPGLISYLRKTPLTALATPSERLTTMSVIAKKLSGSPVKVFAWIHNFNINWLRDVPSSSYRKEYKRIPRYFPMCEKVVCVSEGLRQRFIEESGLPPEFVCTIYNPIITADMYSLAEEPVDHPWFNDGEPPVLIAVGRLELQKDYPTLFKALVEIRKTVDCRLLILGEGKQRENLEQLLVSLHLQDHVDLHGYVTNPYNFIKKADILVLSSIHEAFGNVLVEALALGTPVVSTDCPYGPSEILEGGRYGQLTPVGDPHALAVAIAKALKTPSDPDVLKSAASRFTTETIMQEYLNLFGIKE